MIDIKWDNKFEVGHKRIDFEHQVFVDLIKSISLAADQHDSHERIQRILQEVKKYAEFHFVSEENIMADVNYPQLEQHKQEHVMLLAALDDRIHKYRSERIEVEEIAEFLFQWFALHTTQKDILIAKHIHALQA